MPELRHATLVARQAGSARAFVPLIHRLDALGVRTDVLGLEQARDVFTEERVDHWPLKSEWEAERLLRFLDRPQVLLSGTSECADGDAMYWRWAEYQGVPAVAWVDTWVGMARRFTTRSADPFNERPLWIAVVDERAMRQVEAEGGDRTRVVELGHPGFDRLGDLPDVGEQERRSLLPDDADRLVLFISEPISANGGRDARGYTERTVLPLLGSSLQHRARAGAERLHLAVRPHPREDAAEILRYARITAAGRGVSVGPAEGHPYDLPRVADLVVGMTSILLYESALLGAPVLSLQPDRRTPSAITDDRPGIEVSTEPVEWADRLGAMLDHSEPWDQRTPRTLTPAVDRFIAFMREIATD